MSGLSGVVVVALTLESDKEFSRSSSNSALMERCLSFLCGLKKRVTEMTIGKFSWEHLFPCAQKFK